MNLIVPLYNITFPSKDEIELDTDMKIYPLELITQVKLFEALPSDSFMNSIKSDLRFKTPYYLNIKFESNKDTALRKAYNFLKILRICRNNASSIGLIFIDGDKLEYELPVVQIFTFKNSSIIQLSTNDIEILQLAWTNYTDFIKIHNYNNRIYWAMFLHELANENRQLEMQIVHDTIALESLFSTSSQEISYQVSTRSAWFMYPKIDSQNNNIRTRYYNTIKKYYDIRSKIVHGNFENIKNELDKLNEIDKYIEGNLNCHVRDILKTIITDTNLINIFTRNIKDFNQYLLSLVLKTESSTTNT
jgi:hypothetical protein